MKAEKQGLIKNATVTYMNHRDKAGTPAWYGRFELNIKGFEVKGETEYFNTIDEATQALKDKMAEAVKTFE